MEQTKVLVASHAGVLSVNRAPFQHLARIAHIDAKMIVPQKWTGDLIRELEFHPDPNDRHLQVIPLRHRFRHGALFYYSDSVRGALRQWQPDVIFLDEEPWSFNAFQFYRNFPKARKYFFTKQNLLRRYPFPFSFIEKYIYKRSQAAFTVAEEVSQVLKQKGFDKDIHFLPHSYDREIFHPLGEEERAATRAGLGLRADSVVVAYFGRLVEEKGIKDFLLAAQSLRVNKKIEFLIVGNGEYENLVKTSAAQQSNLFYSPAIEHDKVGQTLAAADVLVVPSRTTPTWKEQFGRVIMEANACNVAVIGSDSGEIPHFFRKTSGGVIFAEGNVQELIDNIEVLADDRGKLDMLKDRGRRYAVQNLTHEAVARYMARKLDLMLR